MSAKKSKKREKFVPVRMWLVLKAHDWSSLTVLGGVPMRCPDKGPHKFLPVFNTKAQALVWENGNAANIKEIETLPPVTGIHATKGTP